MEKIEMRFVNANSDTILVISDNDDIYVFNKDKLVIEKYTPMGSPFDVLELVDFSQDDLYVADVEGFKVWLAEFVDEIDNELVFNILTHLKELK